MLRKHLFSPEAGANSGQGEPLERQEAKLLPGPM